MTKAKRKRMQRRQDTRRLYALNVPVSRICRLKKIDKSTAYLYLKDMPKRKFTGLKFGKNIKARHDKIMVMYDSKKSILKIMQAMRMRSTSAVRYVIKKRLAEQ